MFFINSEDSQNFSGMPIVVEVKSPLSDSHHMLLFSKPVVAFASSSMSFSQHSFCFSTFIFILSLCHLCFAITSTGMTKTTTDLIVGTAGQQRAILVDSHHAHPLSVPRVGLHTVAESQHIMHTMQQNNNTSHAKKTTMLVPQSC